MWSLHTPHPVRVCRLVRGSTHANGGAPVLSNGRHAPPGHESGLLEDDDVEDSFFDACSSPESEPVEGPDQDTARASHTGPAGQAGQAVGRKGVPRATAALAPGAQDPTSGLTKNQLKKLKKKEKKKVRGRGTALHRCCGLLQ